MTITAGDIALLASQVMDDVDEGGGAPTSHVIGDGVSNSVFPDISEVDRAGGRFNLRKVFVAVRNLGTDTYLGSNLIIADPPADPRVSITLFGTGQAFDRRAAARDRVEAYLNRGTVWPGILLENHITGQRSIQLLQRENVDPPTVGRTLFLVVNEGQPTEVFQYVRVTRVSTEIRTFSYSTNGTYIDYTGQVVTCDLSDALRHDFPGSSPNRAFETNAGKTVIRDTLVADAAIYYGASALAMPASLGDFKVRVTSIYSQLVPNSQTEIPLVDVKPSADFSAVLATTPRQISVGGAPFSQRIKISQENRRYNYVALLKPLPAPGSVKLTYRALGRTYTLTDDGQGNLVGSGSGRVNYGTGSVNATLQALPDDRSAVIFYWGQFIAYTNRSADARFRLPEIALLAMHKNIIPGSLTITWLSAGVLKTASANSQGQISGHGEGSVNHATGDIFLRPLAMIDAGGEFSIDYQWADIVEETKTGISVDATGSTALTFSQDPMPGTVSVEWLTVREISTTAGSSVASGNTEKSSGAGTNKVDVSQFSLLNHSAAVGG